MSKASKLSELKSMGLNVPNYIVLSEGVAYGEAYMLFCKLDVKKKYAVRSSANVEDGEQLSFAGLFETYLNVHWDELFEYYSLCVNSKNKERVRKYCEKMNIDPSSIRMEVVVQEMINCEVSGVLFTKNPTNGNKCFYLEAVWGLGEGLVSGGFEGDRISIDVNSNLCEYICTFQKKKLVCSNDGIIETQVDILKQSSNKLQNRDLKDLVDLGKKIKEYYSKDMDIEWGKKCDKIYIFQARPITTGGNNEDSIFGS